jgi:hypothetical protein
MLIPGISFNSGYLATSTFEQSSFLSGIMFYRASFLAISTFKQSSFLSSINFNDGSLTTSGFGR